MMQRAGVLFVVATCWVFCLLAAAGLAVAQESTVAEDDTTAAEDQYPDAAADGSCPNPAEVATVGPTTENTVTPFETTGRTFQVSYVVQLEAQNSFNSVDIDIEDRFGLLDFEIVDRSGAGSFIVTEGAGSYDLVVNVSPDDGATYTVTIKDCGVTGGGDDVDDPGGEGDPGDVIDKTIPEDTKLVETGGFPLLLGAGLLLACATGLFVRVLRG